MIKVIPEIHDESMRLYDEWLKAGRPMSKKEFIEKYASDEFKEYQRVLRIELDKAHAEGLTV